MYCQKQIIAKFISLYINKYKNKYKAGEWNVKAVTLLQMLSVISCIQKRQKIMRLFSYSQFCVSVSVPINQKHQSTSHFRIINLFFIKRENVQNI